MRAQIMEYNWRRPDSPQAATGSGSSEGTDLSNLAGHTASLNPGAAALLAGRVLRETFVENRPDRRKATAAARAATEALIHGTQRPRAGFAADGVPDICVAKDIARTNNHKVTGFHLEIAGSIACNPWLKTAQDHTSGLYKF